MIPKTSNPCPLQTYTPSILRTSIKIQRGSQSHGGWVWRGLIVVLILVPLAWAGQRPAALDLKLIRDGTKRFHVEVSALVPVPERVVWQTVRDYDHLAEFIPLLVLSRRTTYRGLPAIEQVGRVGF